MSEQISALVDDEVDVESVADAVSLMQLNQQAAEAWSQYHLIGDAMRGLDGFKHSPLIAQEPKLQGLSSDFKQRLMSRLELEPTVLSPNAALANHHVTAHRKVPVVWSIAASFAAVMVVGWMALHQQSQPESYSTEVAQVNASEQGIPQEYLVAHQVTAPSASSYYIQSASYSE